MKRISGGEKDANGIFVPKPKEQVMDDLPPDISIDDLLNSGLQCIRKALSIVSKEINTGVFERDTIMNLKDLVGMLRDLKKSEKDILDTLTNEDLEKLIKK